jgi:hypothetical protein
MGENLAAARFETNSSFEAVAMRRQLYSADKPALAEALRLQNFSPCEATDVRPQVRWRSHESSGIHRQQPLTVE